MDSQCQTPSVHAEPLLPISKAPASGPLISAGLLDVLKILGLVAMLLDHGNKWLLESHFAWMTEAGRLAFPLFSIVFSHNVVFHFSSPQSFILKSLTFGILAQWPFATLVGHGLLNGICLNIIFVFFSAWCIQAVWKSGYIGKITAPLLFLASSLLATSASFSWSGIALILLLSEWYRHRTPILLVPVFGCVLSLAPGVYWLAPLITGMLYFMNNNSDVLPRWNRRLLPGLWFYFAYVVHLWIFWLARQAMAT